MGCASMRGQCIIASLIKMQFLIYKEGYTTRSLRWLGLKPAFAHFHLNLDWDI